MSETQMLRHSGQSDVVANRTISRATLCLSSILLVLTSATSQTREGARQPALPTLTSAAQVLRLSPDQANLSYPVRLKGVTTYSDAARYMLFVQDSTGGVYLDLPDDAPPVKSGQLVEVRGHTAAGIFAPMVAVPVVSSLGPAVMPPPRRVSIQELFSGALDSQWVELEGVVRTTDPDNKGSAVVIAASGGQFRAILPQIPPDELTGLVDALVAVRGVCAGEYNQKSQLIGTQLYMPDRASISIKEPAPQDPFALPVRKVNKLLEYAAARGVSHRARVQGVVTLSRPGSYLFLRDDTAGLYVVAGQKNELFPGDQVDVAGFPDWGGFTPALRNAVFRKIGSGNGPAPIKVAPEGFGSGLYDAELIEIEATYLGRSPNPLQRVLSMQSSYLGFSAILPLDKVTHRLDEIPNGSRLRLTGVFSVQQDEFRNPVAYRVLLRSAEDVVVLSRPAWWKLEYTLAVAGVMMTLVLGSLAWVLVLNRKVRAQTGVIRERLEREAALVKQLQQVQKMEAIGSLAGGVAHDFNNILTAILGYTDLALATLKPGESIRADLEAIHKAGERAASLTRQLLAFSRRQLMQPKVLNLNAIVRDMDDMLRRLVGEDIELSTELAPQLGSVKADPSQIEQVILNLVVNARDAMPRGGKLFIQTANVELSSPASTVDSEFPAGAYVRFSVCDNGSGMPKETLDHIFEPFFTTKKNGNGTGLGLATAYGIIRQSGGDISVHSEPGRGTTFEIHLPRVTEAAPADESTRRSGPVAGHERILLVEDDQRVRELAQRVLEGAGYAVLTASDGFEAIDICGSVTGIRLLLTDVVMPKMSGRELVEKITAVYPRIKILYMSGYTDDAMVRHGIRDLGTPFLQKPFSPETLSRTVREVLDTER